MATMATGCAVDPQLEWEETPAIDAGSERGVGTLDLALDGAAIPLSVVAWRVTSLKDNRTVVSETMNLSEEPGAFTLLLKLDPGPYRVAIRGATPAHQPCFGTGDFAIRRNRPASIDLDVVCDEERLAVGMAKLTVERLGDSKVVLSRVLSVDEALGASSLVEDLPPDDYVVWITATSEEGHSCAGSSALTVVAGRDAYLDVLVECQR